MRIPLPIQAGLVFALGLAGTFHVLAEKYDRRVMADRGKVTIGTVVSSFGYQSRRLSRFNRVTVAYTTEDGTEVKTTLRCSRDFRMKFSDPDHRATIRQTPVCYVPGNPEHAFLVDDPPSGVGIFLFLLVLGGGVFACALREKPFNGRPRSSPPTDQEWVEGADG
jgi:hypothetical protein